MIVGKVKWFNNAKGFGFIEQEHGPDVFVHYTVIEMDGYRVLEMGQLVCFDMTCSPRGPIAVHVCPPSPLLAETVGK